MGINCKWVWALVLGLIWVAPLRAEETTDQRPPESTPIITTAETRAQDAGDTTSAPVTLAQVEYGIRPADTLSLTVLGEPAYSGTYVVSPDGKVLFRDDMLGEVAVSGHTLSEVRQVLTRRIGEFIRDPTVLLELVRFRVMVSGEVNSPGECDVAAGTRLADVLARAGGIKDTERNNDRIYLTKVSGQQSRLDLTAYREKGDVSQNPIIEPGDRIAVGSPSGAKAGEYKVAGAFRRPDRYRLKDDEPTRITDAVEQAGRWSDEANPRAAQLIRKDATKLTVDLARLTLDASSAENVTLQDGDELYVPYNVTEVNVLGGVRKEGQYRVEAGTTLLEVLTKAGGLQEGALLKQCAIVRTEPQPASIPIDLAQLIKKGDLTQNPVLQHRDVVYVGMKPPATKKSGSTLQTVTSSIFQALWALRWVGF